MSPPPSPVIQLFARLSTSMKMLVLMSLALAPLGLIASLASIETAHANRANREVAARLLAGDSADQLDLYVDRTAATLRASGRLGAAACRRAGDLLGRTGAAGTIRLAAFDETGRLLCADRGFAPHLSTRPTSTAPLVTLDAPNKALDVLVGVVGGKGWMIAELPGTLLTSIGHPDALDGSFALALAMPGGPAVQLATMEAMPIGKEILIDLPIATSGLRLQMRVVAAPLSANELLLTLLPILMWIAGAAIGWVVVDRLLVRPLGEMQAAVEHYRLQGGRLTLPRLTTPALEIQALGDAFTGASDTIVRHEGELEEGLARQTRLTREVHHRVKNNLQVVASLLNIHARGAATPAAADAYATIQRRVDALALVHRSHYAEMEVNQGVALRPLIGELASTLRGSAPQGTAPPHITLDLALQSASQDVAVSAAFFITEGVEAAMLRGPGAPIAIRLGQRDEETGRARLSIASPALAGEAAPPGESAERFDRIIGGLARQLRATLERDGETGVIAVAIQVLASGPAGDDPA